MKHKKVNNTAIRSASDRQRTSGFFQKLKEDPAPKVVIFEGSDITPDQDTVAKMSLALGTVDSGVMGHFLGQVEGAFSENGSSPAAKCNNALSILYSVKPKDELESMLAIQMIGVHNLAMQTLARANLKGQTILGVDSNVNRATKLLRTFTTQLEALNRYRGNAQQTMTVEHIHVNEGGQAIVGTVNRSAGEGKHE